MPSPPPLPPPVQLRPKSQLRLSMETVHSGEVSNFTVPLKFEVRSQQGLIGSKIEGEWYISTCRNRKNAGISDMPLSDAWLCGATVVGDVDGLGKWRLQNALVLHQEQMPGEGCVRRALLVHCCLRAEMA